MSDDDKTKTRKETQKKYYQKNKERIKARQKERWAEKQKNKHINRVIPIGARTFRFKREIAAYFKAVLANGEVGDVLPTDEMTDLICRHPDYEFSWTDGASFAIGRTMGHKCFMVKNKKGSFFFSYHKCVASAPKDKYNRKNIQSAARFAVLDQVLNFRASAGNICAVSGKELLPGEIHVDHDFSKKAFQELLDKWLTENKWSYADIELKQSQEDELFYMADPYLTSWQEFHKDKACLRIVQDKINCAN